MYFPSSEILITNLHPHIVKGLEYSLNCWRSYAIRNAKKLDIFFAKDKKASKRVLTLTEPHLGHHLWNKLSGIYQIHEWNQLEDIDEFFVVHQPLGKLEDIFPEIPLYKIRSVCSFNEDYVDSFIENNYLPTIYGFNFVKQDLANRVYRASLKKCSPVVIQEIEDAKKQHFPLLWVNIRTGSRSWISQIEGTANIINKLFEKFPNLGIVFDGTSRLEEQSKDFSSSTLEAEIQVLHEIENLIQKPIQTYNLIGRIIYENLVWVKNIDLYLSHWGNGLTKPVLIANKPGVAHCNQLPLKAPVTERWISWHRENCILPTYISSDRIQDVPDLSCDARRPIDNNYDVDWQIMYQELLKVIPKCERYHSQMEAYYKSRLEAIKANLESSRFRLTEIRRNLSDNLKELENL